MTNLDYQEKVRRSIAVLKRDRDTVAPPENVNCYDLAIAALNRDLRVRQVQRHLTEALAVPEGIQSQSYRLGLRDARAELDAALDAEVTP